MQQMMLQLLMTNLKLLHWMKQLKLLQLVQSMLCWVPEFWPFPRENENPFIMPMMNQMKIKVVISNYNF